MPRTRALSSNGCRENWSGSGNRIKFGLGSLVGRMHSNIHILCAQVVETIAAADASILTMRICTTGVDQRARYVRNAYATGRYRR
jgi:hypothetical protein